MAKKLTTDEFISRSKALHGDGKYDYSECVYTNDRAKVRLRCIRHDHKFETTPSNHIHGANGCTKCAGQYKPNTTEFIEQSKTMHGELKYDYSECLYKNSNTKIKLRCIAHDYRFSVMPNNHIHRLSGCPKCTGNYRPSLADFIAESINLYGTGVYDYSNCVYINRHTAVQLRCVEHDYIFNVTPANHLYQGTGCPVCNPHGWSKKAVDWLEWVAYNENVSIQYANNGSEFKIPNTRWKADGYCKTTNTIYEFHGDDWHGNPDKHTNDINCHPFTNETAGELYTRTINREQSIRDLGYNLIVIWEREWDQIKKNLIKQ